MNQPETLRPGGEKEKRKILYSAAVLAACYVIYLAVFFVIIVTTTSWKEFIVEHLNEEIIYALTLFFMLAIGFVYFYFEGREVLFHAADVVLYALLVLVSLLLCWTLGRYISIYARPYAFFALLCLFLFGRKHALFLHSVFALIMFCTDLFNVDFAGAISNGVYSMLIIGFSSGILSVFVASRSKMRLGLLLSGIIVSLPSFIMALLIRIPFIFTEGWIQCFGAAGFCVFGCVVSSVLALALLPLFERMFNRLTPFRLRELTSTNAPILNRLKKEAPGTFNHSLIVAHLAETCAVAIGENAELARAAAYYHDVGKLKQPDCFTENQTDYNVHDELTPELSADIIRSHATDGYDLLVHAHLPKPIADVALQHHGTLPIKYFYDKAMRISGGEADVRDYSYFGPTPQTKVAAIIMISDAAEAATRALKDRSPENVERTVRSIIEERMDLDQFAECDITMRELTIIKQTIVEALSGIHHHRVQYPAIRFNREHKAVGVREDRDE